MENNIDVFFLTRLGSNISWKNGESIFSGLFRSVDISRENQIGVEWPGRGHCYIKIDSVVGVKR